MVVSAPRRSAGQDRLRFSDGTDVELSTPKAAGRSRLPEISVGLLLVAGCALIALWWQSTINPTESVIVAREPIQRGVVLESGHLAAVEVSGAEGLGLVLVGAQDELLGQVTLVPIEAGKPILASMVGATSDLSPGEAVVGVHLASGRAPGASLRIGMLVDVVKVSGADAGSGVLASKAEVVEVRPMGASGEMLVSLRVGHADGVEISQAAADGDVSLIEVGGRATP